MDRISDEFFQCLSILHLMFRMPINLRAAVRHGRRNDFFQVGEKIVNFYFSFSELRKQPFFPNNVIRK